jgi:hypothetical protein
MGSPHCDVTSQGVSHEEIAQRAYELWQARGCPEGDGSEDWDAALSELASRQNGGNRMRHWWERMRRSIVGRDS